MKKIRNDLILPKNMFLGGAEGAASSKLGIRKIEKKLKFEGSKLEVVGSASPKLEGGRIRIG